VRPYLPRILVTFGLSLFGTALGLLWPLFTKLLIDQVLLGRNVRLLVVLVGAMLLTTLVGYVGGAIGRYQYTLATANVLFALRQHVFTHLQALSMTFHSRARVGDLLSRLNTDIADVQAVLTDAVFTLLTNVFVLLGTIGLLLWLNWKLFLVSVLALPLQLYIVGRLRPRIVEATRAVRELNAEISSFLIESLSAIKFVKLFAAERLQQGRLERLGERFVAVVTRSEMLSYLGSAASTASTAIGGAITTLYGGILVIGGEMTVGGLIAFLAYQSRAFSPVQVLVGLYLRIERCGVSLARVFEFLDLEEETSRGPNHQWKRVAAPKGEIEFRNVSFSYDPVHDVLRSVSFQVPAGTRVVLLGPSGSGKTTLIDLLVGLYAPKAGSIAFDGCDLRELDPNWLRQQVVVVGHEPVLFHASLLENLRYADPHASLEAVRDAARVVGLDKFVASLPDGYETVVGERGMRLSAGQKQRVALARAVLRRPTVLVLDEAYSGLDVESERDLRATLDELMIGRTTIMATHRLSSLRADDTVLVIEKGRVVRSGALAEIERVGSGSSSEAGRGDSGRAALAERSDDLVEGEARVAFEPRGEKTTVGGPR
jgi:ATP-binding cassette subfamily B protein